MKKIILPATIIILNTVVFVAKILREQIVNVCDIIDYIVSIKEPVFEIMQLVISHRKAKQTLADSDCHQSSDSESDSQS